VFIKKDGQTTRGTQDGQEEIAKYFEQLYNDPSIPELERPAFPEVEELMEDPDIPQETVLRAIKATNYSKAIGIDVFDGKSILKDDTSK
jgi:hypothetical protein